MTSETVIEISGAGPAGLAAALAATRAGCRTLVYERRRDVGLRFHGDFQGLENWTTKGDVLEELATLGISTDFDHTPFRELTCFGPEGSQREVRTVQPLFYLLRRGHEAGTLDFGLKQQALAAGVEIRFNEMRRTLPNGGIVTEGPHRADAIATGYLFETDMADAACAVVNDQLAPNGYGYLLTCNGQGTLATCLFDDFHNERVYLDRCVEFFRETVGIRMDNPRRFGGSGNFGLPATASKGNILYAGEAAGFQDPLFGFGIRAALLSGAAAGHALATGRSVEYERFWRQRLQNAQITGASNRWFYERLGNRGYRYVLRHYSAGEDIRNRLRHAYAPNWWKRAWYHLAVARRHKPVLEMHEDCDCTWCRCERSTHAAEIGPGT